MSAAELPDPAGRSSVVTCPECGGPCIPKAIKAGLRRIYGCPKHGLVDHWSCKDPQMLACRSGVAWMNPEERLWLLDRAFEELMREPVDRDYLILEDPAAPEHYVQFLLDEVDSTFWAEVGSREWNCKCGNRPLPPESVRELADLGFVGGGVCKNYSKEGVTGLSPIELAVLAEQLFVVAYRSRADFEVAVQYKRDIVLHRLHARLIFERALS